MKHSESSTSDYKLKTYSAGIDFIRQILMSIRQILTCKADPRTVRLFFLQGSYTHNKCIQMKRIELTKTIMMISN